MQTSDYTINDLFNGENVFLVPRYQRLYVWNEEDQWAPLWDDVLHIAERLFDDAKQRGSAEIDQSKAESHFIGTLVLKPRLGTLGAASKWQVIDGQQRLTTLQLMMSAVSDEFGVRGLEDGAVRNLISNRNPRDPLKIEHREFENGFKPYDGFREAMVTGLQKDRLDGPMGDCYRFFSRSVAEWLDIDSDADLSETRANALGTAILFRFRLVAIELDAGEEEHKIFETLNARGAPLTEWDKMKNMFLAKVDKSLDDDTQDDFYAKHLNRFDDDWWRQGIGSGAQHRPRSDWFADYWVESKTGEPVGVKRVFREFQQYTENCSVGIERIADELTGDAEYYQKYERRCAAVETVERRFHNLRLAIGIGALWPAILELNRAFERLQCSLDARSACFSYLESYLLRRNILGWTTQGYAQLSFDLIETIRRKATDPSSLIRSLHQRLSTYTLARHKWPNDNDVRWAVSNRQMSRATRALVLRQIEAALVPSTAGYQMLADDLEVEHLMPQGWRDNDWPTQSDDIVPNSVDIRNDLIQTLGNLTLVNSGLNKRLNNGSWQHKREFIAKSDNLFINKRLLEDASDTWDERKIASRGIRMAEVVCEIWPRPDDVANN